MRSTTRIRCSIAPLHNLAVATDHRPHERAGSLFASNYADMHGVRLRNGHVRTGHTRPGAGRPHGSFEAWAKADALLDLRRPVKKCTPVQRPGGSAGSLLECRLHADVVVVACWLVVDDVVPNKARAGMKRRMLRLGGQTITLQIAPLPIAQLGSVNAQCHLRI